MITPPVIFPTLWKILLYLKETKICTFYFKKILSKSQTVFTLQKNKASLFPLKIYKHSKTYVYLYRDNCIDFICLKQLKILFGQWKRKRIAFLWKPSLGLILYNLAFADTFIIKQDKDTVIWLHIYSSYLIFS